MKLIFYEIKKILCKKVFFIILALCLIFNIGVFFYNENNSDNQPYISADYTDLVNEYSSMSLDEAEEKLNAKNKAYEILTYIDMLATAQSAEELQDYLDILDEYRAQSPVVYSEAENMINYVEYNENEQIYIYNLISQIEYIKSYPDFINEMYDRADKQSSFSIFSNQNDFSYKNLYKTADDYKHLSEIKLTIGNNLPVTSALNYHITDYLLVVIVFFVCIYIFHFEKNKGLYNLVRSSKHGRLKLIAAKLFALFIITAIISIVFVLSNFIISTYLYGGFNLSRAVQSIPDFRNCIFALNIGQFCVLTILCKTAGMIIIAAVFAVMFCCLSKSSLIYTASIGLIASEYLLNVLIPSFTAFNHLKYINVFYLLDGYSLLGNYINLNIFATPICAYTIDIVVFAVIFVTCIIICCIVFTIKKQPQNKSILAGSAEKIKSRYFKINGTPSVLYGEAYKCLFKNKMALILISLIIFSVFSSFGTVRYPYTSTSDASYKSYMEYLEGNITEEKINYINEQNQYFEKLKQRINEIISDETLSENAKSVAINSIQNTLDTNGTAFARINSQYEHLVELQKNGIKTRFIDENIYQNFIFSSSREWNNLALILLILIISIPFIYTVEYKNKMIDLIRPTKYGKFTLMRDKLIISVLILMIIFTAVYLPYLIRFINTFGTNSFSTNIVCLNIYGNTYGETSIIEAFTLTAVCYLMTSLLAVGVITLVSVLCKNHLLSMIISTVVVLIPCLLLYSADNIRVGTIFYENHLLTAFVIILTCIVITILCMVIASLMFTNTRGRRKNVKP